MLILPHTSQAWTAARPRPLRWLADRTPILFMGLALGWCIRGGFVDVGARPPPPSPAAASAGPVRAQQPTQALDRAIAARRPIRIGVYGDSFGDGAWGALARRRPGELGMTLSRFSEQGSGLARSGAEDLLARTRTQTTGQPMDIAVVSLGANDTRSLLVDGHVASFGNSAWRRAYGQRVGAMARLLQAGGAQVYWLGLPRMRDEGRDRDVGVQQAVVREQLAQFQVPFLEGRSLTSDPQGRYAPYLPDPAGRRRLMRAGDGVHMTSLGYDRLAEPAWAEIRTEVAAARARSMLAVKRRPAPQKSGASS